jgi:predicted outer membrane repeat protein
MKVKQFINGFSTTARVMVLCLAALWVPVTTVYAQTAAPRSYYVRANGDDNNNGRSEDAPFKTLAKAVDAAKAGVIKQVTVLGKIEGARFENTGNDEILITGKLDATAEEKAEITSYIRIGNAKIRFTHVSFSRGFSIESGNVTLGAGTLASEQIEIRSSTLAMTDDATVSGGIVSASYRNTINMSGNARIINSTQASGVSSGYDLTLTMSDNAEISGNITRDSGGGVWASEPLTLTMSGNARIINNTASENGGGIYARGGTITLSDNAHISGNTAGKDGGGIYYGGTLTINGGEISGNTAKNGGGVFYFSYRPGFKATMTGGTITGNKAEYGAGVYVEKDAAFTFNGGTITGNEAEFVGGGVYAQSGSTYTAGGGTVTDNTAGDGGANVFRQQ